MRSSSRSLLFVGLVCLAAVGFFILLNRSIITQKAHAYSTSCPPSMTDAECLEYLQEQASLVQKDRKRIEKSIKDENMEQMTLTQQIAYLASTIEQTELEIAAKEIDIEKKNLEIKLLGEDILGTQNSIDTLTQEINRLEDTIKKRTRASYKLTFVSPVEIFLDSSNLETMMRRMKYLMETKKKDRELLDDMSISKDQLAEEEAILAQNLQDVQTKRNEVESQMAALAEDRTNLQSQKSQQQSLLAESRRRQQEYIAQLDKARKSESALDGQIIALISKMDAEGKLVKEGYVSKGAVIGYMGSTGCANAAHLHFSINNNKNAICWYGDIKITGVWCGTVSPWSGSLVKGPDWDRIGRDGWKYYYVRSGSMRVPLGGSAYLTQDFHQGTAIDLSTTTGPGAPVYSAMAGQLETGVETVCQGKFAKITAGGTTTVYLHLR